MKFTPSFIETARMIIQKDNRKLTKKKNKQTKKPQTTCVFVSNYHPKK